MAEHDSDPDNGAYIEEVNEEVTSESITPYFASRTSPLHTPLSIMDQVRLGSHTDNAPGSSTQPRTSTDMLFYPWWKSDGDVDNLGLFLVKAKLHGQREGLLVDPGAHDNL
eukprot:7564471-Karenia_brevis.AAC.1